MWLFLFTWYTVDCIRNTVSSFRWFSLCRTGEEIYWTVAACSAEATEMVWTGAPFLWEKIEGMGLLQPADELALGRPSTSLLVLTRRLSKRLSQALSWSEKVGEWRTVVINGNRRGFELRGEKYCKNNWWWFFFLFCIHLYETFF